MYITRVTCLCSTRSIQNPHLAAKTTDWRQLVNYWTVNIFIKCLIIIYYTNGNLPLARSIDPLFCFVTESDSNFRQV